MMTEDQHETLVKLGNEFWLEFSALCEKYLHEATEEGVPKDVAEMYLSERTSWYGRKIHD
jgi:hypothetical protein